MWLTDAPDNTTADLPDIRFVDVLESGYHIIAPIEITYIAVEDFAKPHVEKSHKLKGIDTLVKNLTLYGSGTQLAAGIAFSMPSLGTRRDNSTCSERPCMTRRRCPFLLLNSTIH